MPKKPVFEINGDCRAVIVDEKSTFEYIQNKLTEKKIKDADPILDRLERWLMHAVTGMKMTINEEKLTLVVSKVVIGL